MTQQELERMLPDHPRGICDNWFDWFHKDQIVSMIFPEYLKPKPYEIIEKKDFVYSGKQFSSTLKVFDGHEWFYCETLEENNANDPIHTRSDPVFDLAENKLEADRGEVAQKKLGVVDMEQTGGDQASSPQTNIPASSGVN